MTIRWVKGRTFGELRKKIIRMGIIYLGKHKEWKQSWGKNLPKFMQPAGALGRIRYSESEEIGIKNQYGFRTGSVFSVAFEYVPPALQDKKNEFLGHHFLDDYKLGPAGLIIRRGKNFFHATEEGENFICEVFEVPDEWACSRDGILIRHDDRYFFAAVKRKKSY